LPCLPKGIKLTNGVVSEKKGESVNVGQRLVELKAHCRDGKLVDGHCREIRFFRFECWGNPPYDYLERERQQSERLAQLKKRYTVIVLGCDPRTTF
jgi:hypothetical protein